MAGYQQLTLVGNVGADPTVSMTEWGPVTNFDVAVNGKHKPPIWYSVAAWGKLGEAMAQYLSKGREVLIESDHFEPVWWTNRRGETETRINVTANRVVFLDGGSPEKSANPQQPQPQQQVSQQRQQVSQQRQQVSQQRQQVSQQRQQVGQQRQQVSQQRPQVSLKLKQVSQQRQQVSLKLKQVSQQRQQASEQRPQVSQPQQQVGEFPEIPF